MRYVVRVSLLTFAMTGLILTFGCQSNSTPKALITGTVIHADIVQISEPYQGSATLNVGEQQGVKEGMIFVGYKCKDPQAETNDFKLYVERVSPNSCSVRLVHFRGFPPWAPKGSRWSHFGEYVKEQDIKP